MPNDFLKDMSSFVERTRKSSNSGRKSKKKTKNSKYVPIPGMITPKGPNIAERGKRVMERGFKSSMEDIKNFISHGSGGAGITADRIRKRKKRNNP